MDRHRGRGLLTWGPTLLFNVVLPFATYQVVTGRGMGTVPALTTVSAWPVVELGVFYVLHHRVDELGVMALVFFGLGVGAAAGFHSAHLVEVKDSAVTGLIGIVMLASLALPRPMSFYTGRKFATDGTSEGIAHWNDLWRYPSFRRAQLVITVVWGLGFLVEAGVRIALSYPLATSAMVPVNSLLPAVVVAGLIGWTVGYGRRVRAGAGVTALPTPQR
jgi:hypothetical protein